MNKSSRRKHENRTYEYPPPQGLSEASNSAGMRREKNHWVLRGTAGQILVLKKTEIEPPRGSSGSSELRGEEEPSAFFDCAPSGIRSSHQRGLIREESSGSSKRRQIPQRGMGASAPIIVLIPAPLNASDCRKEMRLKENCCCLKR